MNETHSDPARVSGLLSDAFRVPATGLTCLAAITVTLISWITANLSGVAIDPRGFFVLPWTPITSALAHAGLLHLFFNLYWLCRFGNWIELRIGPGRTLILYGLLAIVSGAGEYAWDRGGIGLSGVGYGLFGLLWMRRRVDPEVSYALDRYMIILFVAWFFFCIVLTQLAVYPVGNVAHATGAIMGAGIGWAWNREGIRRRVAILISCTGVVLVLECATVARSLVNSGPGLALSYASRGAEALERRDFTAGLSLGRRAVACDPRNGYAHWYLGSAQVMTGAELEGLASFREADRLGTRTIAPERAWIESMGVRLQDAANAEDWQTVARLANEVLRIDARSLGAWNWVGQSEWRAGHRAEACDAFERAFSLDPRDPTARGAQAWAKLTRAQLAVESGDLETAYAEIRTGLELAPQDAGLYETLNRWEQWLRSKR